MAAVSVDQATVGEQSRTLLENYMVAGFERDGVENAPRLEDLRRGRPSPPPERDNDAEKIEELGVMLRDIGDELDRDYKLQRLINSLPPGSPIDSVMAVAHFIFDDITQINWGRIVSLFYFAYKMCARALTAQSFAMSNDALVDWITTLITEVIQLLVVKFADWIISRGGWLSIREYMGTSTTIWGTLFAATGIIVIYALYKFTR